MRPFARSFLTVMVMSILAIPAFSEGSALAEKTAPMAFSSFSHPERPFVSLLNKTFEKYPRVILSVAAATFVQSLMIAALLIHSRRRQNAEENLRISEDRYRKVIESQRDMVNAKEEPNQYQDPVHVFDPDLNVDCVLVQVAFLAGVVSFTVMCRSNVVCVCLWINRPTGNAT